jgi:hypothetical protein
MYLIACGIKSFNEMIFFCFQPLDFEPYYPFNEKGGLLSMF